ncbi:Protein transport protein Sec24B [Halocaridina rubra]|uniref:Protein transport protein Sec24B n=1 Tax=Halocaridina rubra TaxID=373956 RepID=A0AAN8WBZ7_HALRR
MATIVKDKDRICDHVKGLTPVMSTTNLPQSAQHLPLQVPPPNKTVSPSLTMPLLVCKPTTRVKVVPQPGRLHLSAERLERIGAYLMDAGSTIYVYVRSGISSEWVEGTLGVPSYAAIPQPLYDDSVPVLDTTISILLRNFITYLQSKKPYPAPVLVLKEDNPARMLFIQHLVDDRTEGSQSYVEFLQYLKSQIK